MPLPTGRRWRSATPSPRRSARSGRRSAIGESVGAVLSILIPVIVWVAVLLGVVDARRCRRLIRTVGRNRLAARDVYWLRRLVAALPRRVGVAVPPAVGVRCRCDREIADGWLGRIALDRDGSRCAESPRSPNTRSFDRRCRWPPPPDHTLSCCWLSSRGKTTSQLRFTVPLYHPAALTVPVHSERRRGRDFEDPT